MGMSTWTQLEELGILLSRGALPETHEKVVEREIDAHWGLPAHSEMTAHEMQARRHGGPWRQIAFQGYGNVSLECLRIRRKDVGDHPPAARTTGISTREETLGHLTCVGLGVVDLPDELRVEVETNGNPVVA